MNDPTLALPGLSPVAGKSVVAKFDGGLLSSDSGVLVLREVEQRLRVADRLAFTGGGLVLLLIGAYGMVATAGLNAMGSRWLVLGTESPTRLRRDLGGRTYSHSDCASTLSPWICCGRSNSRALLAPQSALAGLGDLGNVDPPGQSLCDDL